GVALKSVGGVSPQGGKGGAVHPGGDAAEGGAVEAALGVGFPPYRCSTVNVPGMAHKFFLIHICDTLNSKCNHIQN
ncbi:MAG: hypothetical protein GWN13_25210, partial [Phycisphaerae bacterium]|nr:hypothetical protein [Phycisphaerae bacterium]